MRYSNGIYRDCPFCKGKGCLACPGEADKEYKRQFPDGPQPIAVVSINEPDFAAKIASLLVTHSGASEDDPAIVKATDWIADIMKKEPEGKKE